MLIQAIETFTLKKSECSKQASKTSKEVPKNGMVNHLYDAYHYLNLNDLAWNNGIGPWFYFVGLKNPR